MLYLQLDFFKGGPWATAAFHLLCIFQSNHRTGLGVGIEGTGRIVPCRIAGYNRPIRGDRQ
jgi:hypothetical protein